MDARYKLYCDFRDAYVAVHSSYCPLNLLQSRVVYQSDQHQQVSICRVCGHPQGRGVYPDADKGGGRVSFCYIFADVLYG